MKSASRLSILMLILIGCNSKSVPTAQVDQMKWLVGTWSTNAMGKSIMETWRVANDSTLVGASYFINGQDTLLSEQMHIQQRITGTFFTTQVSDQNEGQAIEFKLSKSTNNAFHFSNKQHDFPQQVVYTHPQADSLWAYIDGQLNGSYNRVDFKMKRIR